MTTATLKAPKITPVLWFASKGAAALNDGAAFAAMVRMTLLNATKLEAATP